MDDSEEELEEVGEGSLTVKNTEELASIQHTVVSIFELARGTLAKDTCPKVCQVATRMIISFIVSIAKGVRYEQHYP